MKTLVLQNVINATDFMSLMARECICPQKLFGEHIKKCLDFKTCADCYTYFSKNVAEVPDAK